MRQQRRQRLEGARKLGTPAYQAYYRSQKKWVLFDAFGNELGRKDPPAYPGVEKQKEPA